LETVTVDPDADAVQPALLKAFVKSVVSAVEEYDGYAILTAYLVEVCSMSFADPSPGIAGMTLRHDTG
jgi:hypothetical protein